MMAFAVYEIDCSAMDPTNDPNCRPRIGAEAQRDRDAEVARLRWDGVPFRRIAERLDMSLGAVQKSMWGSQKFADALAGGGPGDLVAAVSDDELRAADVTCVADIERLCALERYRLRHMPGRSATSSARSWR